jgi:hypothetical protein
MNGQSDWTYGIVYSRSFHIKLANMIIVGLKLSGADDPWHLWQYAASSTSILELCRRDAERIVARRSGATNTFAGQADIDAHTRRRLVEHHAGGVK